MISGDEIIPFKLQILFLSALAMLRFKPETLNRIPLLKPQASLSRC